MNSDKILTAIECFEKDSDYYEMLEAAINHSEIGFLIADAQCNVLKINASQIKITGQEAAYNLGKNMREVQIRDKDLSATVMISETKKTVKIEQHLPNGHSYLVYGNPYFDEQGNLKYIVSNLIDSTEVRQTKELLQNMREKNTQLENKIMKLEDQISGDSKLIYRSKIMENMISLCKKVSCYDTTVLILGESGAGKELVAEFIHENSLRKDKKFVKINCASIPENLLESELFGYEGGAFTGADKKGSPGMFEVAHEGTILLDEIGELPLLLQSKLLRFLQDGSFYRIGGRKPLSADVRILAATNRNLDEMVKKGLFREDLFYRLSVVPIHVPALNQRKEDIPILISHFLKKFNTRYQCKKHFSFETMDLMMNTELKGNVRELQNLVERLLVLTEGSCIEPSDYLSLSGTEGVSGNQEKGLKELLLQYERLILNNYAQKYRTEQELGRALKVSQATVSRKLSQHGIRIIQK